MTIKTLLCGSAFALSAAMALPSAAIAQAPNGIAAASPAEAIFTAKAWAAAVAATGPISTTYKSEIDQIRVKSEQRQALLLQIDKNGDKNIDDAEQAANPTVVSQVAVLENDINTTNQKILMAQAYVIDQVATRYATALQTVISARKINVVMTPDAFVFMPPGTDITKAITAEIDRVLPAAAVTPPANWQAPTQAAQLLQQYLEAQQAQLQAQQQAAAQRAASAPSTAAPGAPRPAAAAPGAPRPAAPAATPPARGATQQPGGR